MNHNLKLLFFICVFVQARCCEDYIKCLGDFVHDFFSEKNVTSDNISEINETRSIDGEKELNLDELGNHTFKFFDLKELGKTLTQALTDVTTIIKDEVKGVFNIDQDFNFHKEDEINTEIHAKAFSVSRITDEKKAIKNNSIVPEINISKTISNNLTKINDELTALKIEIENTLQAEIDAFISQVLDNDTFDWVAVTENNLPEQDYLTTTDTNNMKDKNEDKNNESATEMNSELSTISRNLNLTTKYPTQFTKSKENINKETKPPTDLNKTLEEAISNEISKESIDKSIKELELIANVTINNFTTPSPLEVIYSTSEKLLTANPLIEITLEETANKKELTKTEGHTKAPIDYKLIENVKYNEISKIDTSYYDIPEDNTTDYPIMDYIDLYKDTTNEEVDYVPTEVPANLDFGGKSDPENAAIPLDYSDVNNDHYGNETTIFTWVAALFFKDGANNQFDYACDGILLSDSTVLTAATCLLRPNSTVVADDILVFLGKRSLQATGEGESIIQVKTIITHENFTVQEKYALNDLAVLQLEEPAVFTDDVQPACLSDDGEWDETFTTGWGNTLTLIPFVTPNATCPQGHIESILCATYGNEESICPSYSGVYASNGPQGPCAGALRSSTGPRLPLCFDRTLHYTLLSGHRTWIQHYTH